MGCAFPVSATFILVNGGIFAPEWTLWSLAGLVFLGIGDSCVSYLNYYFKLTNFNYRLHLVENCMELPDGAHFLQRPNKVLLS